MKPLPRYSRRELSLLFSVLAISSCARVQTPQTKTADTQTAPSVTRLETMNMRAEQKGDDLKSQASSAPLLFEKGYQYFRKEQFEAAALAYGRLIAEFPASPSVPLALYNLALSQGRLGRFEEAAATYQRLLRDYPQSPDTKDTLFQLAGIFEQLEHWADAEQVFNRLIADTKDVGALELFEARVRRGAALRHQERIAEARVDLNDALLRFKKTFGDAPKTPIYFVAMAHFELGELKQHEMRGVVIPSDETRLETELEHKCQLLLDAQFQYTKSIKVAHPHWAAAAAYSTGRLYRDLWHDIVQADPPPDMTDEEKEIYLEVLRNRVRVLLKKALRQWERTLKMADRLKLDNEWVDRTRADIREIRQLMAEGD